MTFKNVMKKIACGVLTVASVAACAATFTACETSNPKVTMTLEFNGETYALEYKLYRKIAPATTKHFLWLAENHYYDDMVIHDYDADTLRMYTGAYSLDTEGELEYKDYYTFVQDEERVASFPHSVWMDQETANPTYTLYGEFSSNDFSVKNGNLKETFGSLTMYYHAKETDGRVYAKLQKDNETIARKYYRYNSATSMFYISTVTSATSNSGYCTFATLEDGTDELEALQEAIQDYIEEYCDDDTSEFLTEKKMTVDKDDAFVGTKSTSKTFYVPKQPITIKSVTVKSY